jgi:anti-sigma B factor antagonist
MRDGDGAVSQSMLKASVAAGRSGPVITLYGEVDLTTAAQLSALLSAQLSDGVQELTIDVSRLRFADSASIRALVLVAKTLKERDGSLVLLHPQRSVAKVLELTGAEQMFTILGNPEASQTHVPAQSDPLLALLRFAGGLNGFGSSWPEGLGGAVDRRLGAFAGGKPPGMRCPCAQSLRVMGPDVREAIKGVGNPVFRLRDGDRCGR